MNHYKRKWNDVWMNSRGKKLVCLGVLLIAVGLAWIAMPALAAEKLVAGGVVAVVNGKLILQAHFDSNLVQAQRKLASGGQSLSASEWLDFKKGILEGLIDYELLYQQSQSAGIHVADDAVDNELNTMKKQFPSVQAYKSALVESNTSEADMKAQIKRRLAIQQFVETRFAQQVEISDKQIEVYFDSHKDAFKVPEQIHARHILIKVDIGADASKNAVARKKLQEVRRKLQNGEDFVVLAREYSEAPAETRGDDVYFQKRQMEEPFEEAAFALKPGQVSDIVETSAGYHLIQMLDHVPETMMTFEEVRDSIKQYLKEQKTKQVVQQYIEELKRDAIIERLLSDK